MHPDRYFPADITTRDIARRLYIATQDLPIKAKSNLKPELFLERSSSLRVDFERLKFNQLLIYQSPLDRIEIFEELKSADFGGKLVPIYVADSVVDPQISGFVDRLDVFGTLTGCDAYTWKGYLEAHRIRRELFKLYGATFVLCQPPTAQSLNLDGVEMASLFRKVCIGKSTAEESERFRAAMLCEFAKMSMEDGLALHIQAGFVQMPNIEDVEPITASVPVRIDYSHALLPLLQRFGQKKMEQQKSGHSEVQITVLTHDEQALSTELLPLTTIFPALHVGMNSRLLSPRRLRDFRNIMAEIVGRDDPVLAEGDDLQALADITDIIRRIDAAFIAEKIARHEIDES